ncbi:hypothetical protein ACFLZV_03155 [Candidatus Margulisiibacteriota bacterium]
MTFNHQIKKILILSFMLFVSTSIYGKLSLRSTSFNSVSIKPTVMAESGETISMYRANIISVLPVRNISVDSIILSNTEPAIIGIPLVYPNPLRMSEGGVIAYKLSKAMDIEIRMYNMFAHEVFRKIIGANEIGGQYLKNEVPFNINTLDGFRLPAGVYFYIIMHDGKILGRGKLGIVP